jgi:hypothetical protein
MKTPEMNDFLNDMAKMVFGWDGNSSNCRTCNKPIGEFRDQLSVQEFGISGMCQSCQDSVFGPCEDCSPKDDCGTGLELDDVNGLLADAADQDRNIGMPEVLDAQET